MSGPLVQSSKPPLCVDLDGTLIDGDVIHHALNAYCQGRPWRWLLVGLWLLRGRAFFKSKLHEAQWIDPRTLRYDQRVLQLIRDYKARGHTVFLVTAADQKIAQVVFQHVGLFDGYYASDGVHNYRAHAKGRLLTEIFGPRGFLYVGNSSDDLKVWAMAAGGYVVNASPRVIQKAMALGVTEIS